MTDRVNATNNTRRQVERKVKAKAAAEVGDEEILPPPIEEDGSESKADAKSPIPAAKRCNNSLIVLDVLFPTSLLPILKSNSRSSISDKLETGNGESSDMQRRGSR